MRTEQQIKAEITRRSKLIPGEPPLITFSMTRSNNTYIRALRWALGELEDAK